MFTHRETTILLDIIDLHRELWTDNDSELDRIEKLLRDLNPVRKPYDVPLDKPPSPS